MKSLATPQFTWYYLENPEDADLSTIKEIFDLRPIFLEEFKQPTYRPRVDEYPNYLFLVLHFPVFNKKTRATEVGEVDILVNDQNLVTSCSKHQFPLFHYFESVSKKQKNMRPGNSIPKSSYELLLMVINTLMNSCFPKLDHIACNLNQIEEEIFKGREKRMVKEISIVKRDILNFRRTIKPQRSILESLNSKPVLTKDLDLKTRINDIIGTNIRVWNVLENHKETIDSLEATNDSLFSHRLSEIMKTLTVFSAIMLPASLFVNILGVSNTLTDQEFWLLLMSVILMMFVIFFLMKKKRWL